MMFDFIFLNYFYLSLTRKKWIKIGIAIAILYICRILFIKGFIWIMIMNVTDFLDFYYGNNMSKEGVRNVLLSEGKKTECCSGRIN